MTNLPVPHRLGIAMVGFRLLWQLSGALLEYAGHDVTVLTKSLYFKGDLAAYAICQPTWILGGHSLMHIVCSATKGSVAKACNQARASP